MVVDRNAEMRWVIRRIVGDLADEIHECATPSDAYTTYRGCHPDVVVMDLGVPPCDGIWATRQILSLHPQATIVLVAPYPDATFRATAILAGARGFVLKENLLELRRWLQVEGRCHS
ncbi:MAG: response regulator transcription factor [Vicinamibacterales bacterium]